MKSVCAQFVLALSLFACTRFVIGQDQIGQDQIGREQETPRSENARATTIYTYAAVNAPGASNTLAYGINDGGEIVGYITGGDCATTSDQSSCGFVDIKGKFTTVACELENATDFFDISNADEVVGTYSFFGGVHGLIWQGSESCFDIVDPSGADSTEAWGVSAGNIAGYYTNSAGNFEGFRYTGKTQAYANVKCAGWTNTRAYGINVANLIVGDVSNSTSGPFHGMLYNGGKCTIFNYPGAVWTSAKGINKNGVMSGWYTDTAGKFHGFVMSGTSFVALNYPKAVQTQGYHLNDQGQVAGVYTDTAGADHGFIATPKTAAVAQDQESDAGVPESR